MPESTCGQLTIGVPVSEKDFWLSGINLPATISVCTVEINEIGDLVVTELLNANNNSNLIFFCLAYINPRNCQLLENIAHAPELRRYFSNTAIIQLQDSVSALLPALLESLSDFLTPLVRHSADQALALSSVRREYERVHLRFSALESYVQRSVAQMARERLFVSADRHRDGDFVFIDAAARRLKQLLPVSSKGLCCIDIFVRFMRIAEPGQLRVALLVGDLASPEAEWVLSPFPTTPPEGRWYSLALNRSLDGIAQTVHLQLETENPNGSKVLVAAGGLVANGAYCAQDLSDGCVAGNRPIAMRIWEAPPGLLTPRAGNITLSEPRFEAAPMAGRLPGTSLQHVRELRNESWKPEFTPVSYIANEETIGVHPPDAGVCGAILDEVVPQGALSVSAIAFIANEASHPVEFALAVVEPIPGGEVGEDFIPQVKGVIAWSGWRSVAPRERHQLTVLLGPTFEVSSDRGSLIMLTRMENGAPNSFAWARFADVTIEAAV